MVRRTLFFFFGRCVELLFASISLISKSLGDLCDSGTPGNIPNPVVKAVSADGTWRATSRESRSLPRGFSFNLLLLEYRVPGQKAGDFFVSLLSLAFEG